MGKLTEKQLTIATIAVATVVTGVFATLIYLDFQKIEDEKSRAAKADANIQKAQTEIDRMRQREQNVIIFREIVGRDAKVLPDEAEIAQFWREIKKFKEISNVQIERIDGLDESRKKKKGKSGGQAITPLNIRLSLKADMAQALKFMNLFENFERLVTINSVSMSVGRKAAGDDLDTKAVRHNVSLSLTTYVYNPRGGTVKQVSIDKYEKRKQDEEIKRGIRQYEQPKKEIYQLRPNLDRRDPLVSPRRPPEIPEDGKTLQQIYEEQKNLLDRLVLRFQFIQSDVENERILLEGRDYLKSTRLSHELDKSIRSLEDEISKVGAQRMITIEELLEEFESEIVSPFRKLQSERVTREDVPLTVNLREVRDCLKQMRAAFDKAEYAKVLDTYESYKIYSEGREVAADARRLEEEIVDMARRATVVSDFESRRISINALIVGRTRSVALINGKSVAEGDPIEAGSKILLKEVRSDGCTFLYEGVEIARSTRRTSGK